MQFIEFVTMLLTPEQGAPAVKNKLNFVITRLDRSCSEEDGEDTMWNENDHERRAKLFE